MLGRLVGDLDRLAAFAACVAVVALLGCVSLGVVTRSLGAPLIWTDELSRFLMVWLAVFGWILASRRRIHVRIRFLQDRLPGAAHKATELSIQIALALFGALVCAYGAVLVMKNLDLEATTLPLSMAWMYAPMMLAGAVAALQAAREALGVLKRAKPASLQSDDKADVE